MKENKYDNEKFFQQYSRFPRSVEGLSAAGEWHEFQAILPKFQGKKVLDIGCGFGWHCIYAAEKGADHVIGIDISEKMLNVAKEKTVLPQVEYRRMAMEDLDFTPDTFDVVISSLAFHYTPDFSTVCQKISRLLVPDGVFVFSVEHPVFTAYGSQEWIYDHEGNRQHWPVDNYFSEGKRNSVFLGEQVVKYHKTLTTYISTLLNSGFMLTRLIEPCPADNLLDTIPDMKDELRRPMMLLVAAVKI